jgi:ribosomal subunit interface protein
MDIRVSGQQIDVGTAMTGHVETSLEALVDKYGVRATGANVTLKPGPHDAGFVCDILLQLTQGLVLKASDRSTGTAQLAFDGAADKIDTQLRRYKRRLDSHHRANGPRPVTFDAEYRVLRAPEPDAEPEAGGDSPLIVAETRVDIPEASVSDAVMMLDLRNTGALMFRNVRTGAYNMVYRRDDGHIGWVEPPRGAAGQ